MSYRFLKISGIYADGIKKDLEHHRMFLRFQELSGDFQEVCRSFTAFHEVFGGFNSFRGRDSEAGHVVTTSFWSFLGCFREV